MRLANLSIILALSLLLSGCAATGGTRSPGETIRDHTGDITRFTQLAANIAFLRDDVKEHKDQICAAIYTIADVLDDIGSYILEEPVGADASRTFDSIRSIVLNAIKNLEFEGFTPIMREITVLVLDQILNAVFDRIEGRYGDLLDDVEEGYAPIVASKAIAAGLKGACDSVMSITTFGVEDK